jgi:hypothetical protein
MALWVNVHNAGTTIARARVLGLWADAGSSPASWRFIDLTRVVAFVPGDSAVKISWDIPAGLTTTHACQRVYVLPELDNPMFPEASIRGISTPTQLQTFETAYGFGAGAAAAGRAAQMNFTNFSATADCTNAACKIALLNHDVRPLALSLLSLLSLRSPSAPGATAANPGYR